MKPSRPIRLRKQCHPRRNFLWGFHRKQSWGAHGASSRLWAERGLSAAPSAVLVFVSYTSKSRSLVFFSKWRFWEAKTSWAELNRIQADFLGKAERAGQAGGAGRSSPSPWWSLKHSEWHAECSLAWWKHTSCCLCGAGPPPCPETSPPGLPRCDPTTGILSVSVKARVQAELGFPGGSAKKSLPASAGHTGSIPGMGRSPGGGHGNPIQYSCLDIPMDRGAWRAKSMGSQRVGHSWVTNRPPPPPHTHTQVINRH